MNSKSVSILLFVAFVVAGAALVEAHKKFYSGPQFEGPREERCVCDCNGPPHHQPVLPNKPYYGSAGYAQPPRHGGGSGYGNAGSYAVAGSYGSGGGQVNGGY